MRPWKQRAIRGPSFLSLFAALLFVLHSSLRIGGPILFPACTARTAGDLQEGSRSRIDTNHDGQQDLPDAGVIDDVLVSESGLGFNLSTVLRRLP